MTSSLHTYSLYSPAQSRMEDTAKQAMLDRYNGVFAPLEISAESFKAAYDTPDIGAHIEKDYKGLSYLSWPFAFRYLKEHFPSLYVAFEEKTIGEVVFGGPGYYYLRPYLTDGIRRTAALVFPVMDRKHNAIQQLDGRAISDNCQRASVKAIATFTGLGLRLYAGEDIPKEDNAKPARPALQQDAPKEAGAKVSAPSTVVASETTSDKAEVFDAKSSLVAFCKANPFGYEDEQRSMTAGKMALETLGMSRATEIKDIVAFKNVVTGMLTAWTKEQGLRITKVAMKGEMDAITSCSSVEEMIKVTEAFVAKKQ